MKDANVTLQPDQSEKYLLEDGVLYTACQPENRLVVPTCIRPLVLHLAHSIPWAGHLGQDKTGSSQSSLLLAF